MRRLLAALLIALTFATPLLAQTGSTSNSVAWDQVAPNVATANAYIYTYYPDGSTTGAPLPQVTCTGTTSPFQCAVTFPAFTPGAHTLQLTAKNQAGESAKSTAFAFTFVVIPTAPGNIHII